MIAFFKNRLNRGAVRIALGSFLIGHALFLSYLAFPTPDLRGLGLVFMVLFIVIYILLLATLGLNTLIRFRDFEENLTALILAAINIPLAFLYLNLLF